MSIRHKGQIISNTNTIENVNIHGIPSTIDSNKGVDLSVVEQLESVPNASEELLNRIIQYTGTTTSTFINGYFYKCNQIQSTEVEVLEQSPIYVATITDSQKMKDGIANASATLEINCNKLKFVLEELAATNYFDVYAYEGDNEYVYLQHVLNSTLQTDFGFKITTTGPSQAIGDYFIIGYSVDYAWEQVNVQPATQLVWGNITGALSDQTDLQGALDSKLTTTDEASKVYGTNDHGEQVRYDVNDFGQIDNVAIHGVDQTITDKRVDLKVVEQENSLPAASEDLVGRIVQYTGTTDQTYTHGYFYECKVSGAPSEAICTATDSGTLYPYHITIDKDTFETQITTGGEYVFQYNGTNWTLSGTAVDLADYGISIQEGITYSSGDNMYIQYTESTIGYSWSPVSVQTSTVFRRIVEE